MKTSTAILSASMLLCACDLYDARTVVGASYRAIPCDQPLPEGQTPDRVECGELSVPESWESKAGRTLTLRTVVLKSTSADPEPDAFVYVSGGPGSSALDTASAGLQIFTAEFAAPIQAKRDLVFIDPRGSGRSRPQLDCPEVADAFLESFAEPQPIEADRAQLVAASERCFERLGKEGADFTGYTSAQMAADLDALRALLGYDSWNVWGVSYGTRVLQTLLRDRPEHVRSAILDSVAPVRGDSLVDEGLAFQEAFTALSAACRASTTCSQLTPDLQATYTQLVATLDENPVETHPLDRDTGEPATVFITGTRFGLILQQAMYLTDLLPQIPALIVASTGPNAAAVLEPLIDPRGVSRMAEGVYFSVRCQESYPFLTEDDIARGRRDLQAAYRGYQESIGLEVVLDVCSRLQLKAADDIEAEVVRSDVPSLFLAGGLDPITRPQTTRAVSELFSHAHFYEFPGFGHGIVRARSPEPLPRCAMQLMASFLDDPSMPPDASCLEHLPALTF